MIQHLVNGVFGSPSHSKDERERDIVAAAKELPELCDKLELLPPKQTTEQTTKQTIAPNKTDDCLTKSKQNPKPWTNLATDLKKRWFSEMRKRKMWIPRNQFITDFLDSSEGKRSKWNDLKASTEDRRFQDNPEQWKTESEALKTQFKNRR